MRPVSARCACGASVLRVETLEGARVLDPEEVYVRRPAPPAKGSVEIITDVGVAVTGDLAPGPGVGVLGGYRPHWPRCSRRI